MKIDFKLNPPSYANFINKNTIADESKPPQIRFMMEERNEKNKLPTCMLIVKKNFPLIAKQLIAGYNCQADCGEEKIMRKQPIVKVVIAMERDIQVPNLSNMIPSGNAAKL